MRVSWRSHWQLRSTFCPFEAFYEMLKKNMSLQIISGGTPVVGGALPDISGQPTCHPLFETHTLFSIIVWKRKKFHTSACIQLPGIILCVPRLHHIWKPGQESSDLKHVLFSPPSSSEEKVLRLSRYPTLCIKIAQIEKPGQQSNVYLV